MQKPVGVLFPVLLISSVFAAGVFAQDDAAGSRTLDFSCQNNALDYVHTFDLVKKSGPNPEDAAALADSLRENGLSGSKCLSAGEWMRVARASCGSKARKTFSAQFVDRSNSGFSFILYNDCALSPGQQQGVSGGTTKKESEEIIEETAPVAGEPVSIEPNVLPVAPGVIFIKNGVAVTDMAFTFTIPASAKKSIVLVEARLEPQFYDEEALKKMVAYFHLEEYGYGEGDAFNKVYSGIKEKIMAAPRLYAIKRIGENVVDLSSLWLNFNNFKGYLSNLRLLKISKQSIDGKNRKTVGKTPEGRFVVPKPNDAYFRSFGTKKHSQKVEVMFNGMTEGNYRLGYIPPGEYLLSVSASGGSPSADKATAAEGADEFKIVVASPGIGQYVVREGKVALWGGYEIFDVISGDDGVALKVSNGREQVAAYDFIKPLGYGEVAAISGVLVLAFTRTEIAGEEQLVLTAADPAAAKIELGLPQAGSVNKPVQKPSSTERCTEDYYQVRASSRKNDFKQVRVSRVRDKQTGECACPEIKISLRKGERDYRDSRGNIIVDFYAPPKSTVLFKCPFTIA